MRKYLESAEIMPEVFGLSASNMSKRFKTVTAGRLRQLMTRNLSHYDFLAIFIDGKRFSEEGIVIAVGITIEGEKSHPRFSPNEYTESPSSGRIFQQSP